MTMFGSQWLANPGVDYEIEQSCRFNDGDSSYLTRTPGSAGNRRTWTLSVWVKRAHIASGDKNIFNAGPSGSGSDQETELKFYDGGEDADQASIRFYDYSGLDPSDTYYFDIGTTQVWRDTASWLHLVAKVDTTQGTAANRVILYSNNEIVPIIDGPAHTGNIYPDQNHETAICDDVAHVIGKYSGSSAQFFDGYLAEMHLVDGSALTPSSFAEIDSTTGQWVPKEYTGSYGTTGFYLAFQDSSALGDDTSGNGNDWTSSGLAAADQVTDSPTNNFCTWSAVDGGSGTLSDGNLVLAGTTDRSGTFGMPSGKWAWKITTAASGAFGVVQGSLTGTESTYSAGSGEVLEFQLDISAGTLEVSVDGGSYSSVATGLTSGPYLPLAKAACTADFGQSGFTRDDTSFEYVSTAGLATPTIKDPSASFQTTLYTGNGSTQSIDQSENKSFQPDFVWIKNRDATDSHILTDAVRGVTKIISSDNNSGEATDADTLTAFESNGFALGDDDKVNTNTEKYVAWQWLAGNGTSTNDSGSVDTTVSVNTTAGFSIATFTGTGSALTAGHGLGVVPEMVMVRCLADGNNMNVYHVGIGNTGAVRLNHYNATSTSATYWNDTTPTSTVVTVGTNTSGNQNTETSLMYSFVGVDGYSKFGSYTGNGNVIGPFIFTGFRPACIILKNLAAGESWYIFDDQRLGYNANRTYLVPSTNAVETTGSFQARDNDFLSNGFKIRTSNGAMNSSSVSYIYAAFAHAPFKTANAR